MGSRIYGKNGSGKKWQLKRGQLKKNGHGRNAGHFRQQRLRIQYLEV